VNSISEQASRWAVRGDSDSLTSGERREMDAWLEADPRHRGAYIRARAQWLDLDRLAALNGPSFETLSAVAPEPNPAVVLPSQRSRRQLLAAGLAACTVGSLSWFVWGRSERYTSGVGEVRRIVLDDGSVVSLNTGTEVVVEFSQRRRKLRLVRGEALFEVAHDTARPFVVSAGASVVRAVGTAFAVRVEARQVDVTVTEGVVEVTPDTLSTEAAESAAQRISINQRVTLGDKHAPTVSPVLPADAERRLAWREGMVSFDGESLQNAVAEINRYNRRRIVIDDAALAAMPVVGIFRANDLESFSAAAASALKGRVVVEGDVIRLTRTDAR
jgi:transmembrane sensor